MTHRTCLVPLLVLGSLLAACAGGREDRLRACKIDDDCPEGSTCQDGYCRDDPTVTSGENRLRTFATSQGAEVDIEATSTGGTCRDSACTVRRGATVTFRAPSAAGYRFAGWSGDPGCEGSDPQLVLENVDSDTMCVAHYVTRLVVRGEVDGESGSVEATSEAEEASCEQSGCEVDAGGAVLLRAPERLGFRFDGWSGDGCEDASGVEVTVLTSEHDVTCTAHYVPGFVIRGSAHGAEAAIAATSGSPSAVCAGASCQVDAGADATLTAPALPAYRFTGWTGEAAACHGSAPALTIAAADADLHCIANYLPRFEVRGQARGASPLPTLQASSNDTFAACSGEACTVDHGGSATLLAPTVEGYRLRGWSGDPACSAQTGSAVTLSQVDRDILCSAEYVNGVGVSAAVVGAPASASAISSSPGAMCSGASCVIDAGGSVTLDVTSPAGFTFTGWSGDAGCQSDQLSLTLADVTSSRTCIASFQRLRFTVTTTRSPANGGVVSSTSSTSTAQCGADGCTVDYGADVTLVASPATGFVFDHWSGCTDATTSSTTIGPIDSARSCVANFRRQFRVTTSVSPAGVGSVPDCFGAPCVVDAGGSLTLRSPTSTDQDYVFSGWSGCSGTLGRAGLTLSNIQSDLTCTAEFTRPTHTLTTAVTPSARYGTVTASCGATPCTVASGTNVTLSAATSTNFVFTGWSGCSTSRSASITLTVRSDLTCTANFGDPRPDLVSTLELRGSPAFDGQRASVPVRVTVRNQGNVASSPESKVSIDFTSPRGGPFVASFTVPGQRDTFYAWIPTTLAAGASTTLDGTVTFSASAGFNVTLQALADSCSGDELMPAYCRINEIDETNNLSNVVSLVVPAASSVIGTLGTGVIIDRPITSVTLSPAPPP